MELKLVTVVLALAVGLANAATLKKEKASEEALGKKELKTHARYLGEAFDYDDFADAGSVLDCMVYSMKGDANGWVYVILPLFEQCLCNMGFIDYSSEKPVESGDDGYDYSSYNSPEYSSYPSSDYDSPEYPSSSPSDYPSSSPSDYPSSSPSIYPSSSPSTYLSNYPSNYPSYRSFGYSDWGSYNYYSGSDSYGYYSSDDYYSGSTKRHENARVAALRRRHFARKEGQAEHIAARGEGRFGHVKKGHQVNDHQNQAKRVQEILSELKNLKTHKE